MVTKHWSWSAALSFTTLVLVVAAFLTGPAVDDAGSHAGRSKTGDRFEKTGDGDAVYAVDGDSIVLGGSEKIRIVGYDSPEIHGACDAEVQAAREAKRRLASLLQSGAVQIERRGRDRYGRTLARVLVDGDDVAEIMISEGFGSRYDGGKRPSWC